MCECLKNGPVDAVPCSANGFTCRPFSRTGSLEHRLRNLFQGIREMDLLLDWSNHLLNSSELHTHTHTHTVWVRKSKITLHQIEFKLYEAYKQAEYRRGAWVNISSFGKRCGIINVYKWLGRRCFYISSVRKSFQKGPGF